MKKAPVRTYLQRRWSFLAAVAFMTLLLLLPALYNGYPLLNPDDGTYISSGFLPETPSDRPIIYGLLLRLFSGNGISLWLALSIQAYIVAWLVFRVAQHITGGRLWRPLLAGCAVAFLSSLSWNVSELIPDIFTGIALMSLWLIVTGRESKTVTIVLYLLYFIAVATHMAHVMIFALLLLLLLPFYTLIPAPAGIHPARRLLLLLLLTVATIALMGSALAKSRHVFTMAALLTRGVLKPVLDDQCPAASYRLCAYKDSLPADANEFIWNANSPLYKEGGWEAVKDEYNRIIHISYTRPKYIGLQVRSSLHFTAKQLTCFNIGDGNWVSPPGDYLHETIKEYLPHELPAFERCRQNRGILQPVLAGPNRILAMIVYSSIGMLIVLCLFFRRKTGRLFFFWVVASLLCLLLNAWSCATFSEVTGRYGSKMIWLPVFSALLGTIMILQRRKAIK